MALPARQISTVIFIFVPKQETSSAWSMSHTCRPQPVDTSSNTAIMNTGLTMHQWQCSLRADQMIRGGAIEFLEKLGGKSLFPKYAERKKVCSHMEKIK